MQVLLLLLITTTMKRKQKPSEKQVQCFYCSESMQRKALTKHTTRFHDGQPVREKGFGHPNVDFSAAPILPYIFWRRMPPSAALNIFPAANAANIRRLLYISWRQTPPSAALNIFPAANAAFGGAIRPKRRRVNYEVNHGFSHLVPLTLLAGHTFNHISGLLNCS